VLWRLVSPNVLPAFWLGEGIARVIIGIDFAAARFSARGVPPTRERWLFVIIEEMAI